MPTLKDVLSKIRNQYGEEIDRKDYANPKRIPSGVLVFDILTGGGIPLHKYTTIWGAKSSGKTTQSWRIINNFLNLYPDMFVAYIDFEDSFDSTWAANFIEQKNFDRIVHILPAYGEEGVDVAIKLLEADEVGFLFVDSLAMMVPTVDAEKSATEESVGLLAKLVNKLIRKTLPKLIESKRTNKPLTYLFLNQITTAVGEKSFFGTPVRKPGGKLQDFITSLDIRCYAKDYHKESGIPIKVKYQFNIEKSKIAGALEKRTGEFEMYRIAADNRPAGYVDDAPFAVSLLKKSNILTKENGVWRINDFTAKTLADVSDNKPMLDEGLRIFYSDIQKYAEKCI